MNRPGVPCPVVALALVLSTALLFAREAPVEEVDRLGLAGLLLKDGHADRAVSVLREMDPKAEGVDLPRYHTLFGLAELNLGRHREALEHLDWAVEAGQTDPMVHLFRAQADFALEDWESVLVALDLAGEAAMGVPGAFLLRSQALWRLDDKPRAWKALREGIDRYPDHAELLRNEVLLLADMGLFREAAVRGRSYLDRDDAKADDYVAISEALMGAGEVGRAQILLEEAHMRHPDDERVLAQLARTWLESGRPLTAARLFKEASRYDPKFALDAAELFRKAGRTNEALSANARVSDQKAKIRQRLGLLIDLGRFEEASLMEPRLARLGLMDDEQILYALSYALFSTGRYGDAETLLKRIHDPDLFRRATELRAAMESCRTTETCL